MHIYAYIYLYSIFIVLVKLHVFVSFLHFFFAKKTRKIINFFFITRFKKTIVKCRFFYNLWNSSYHFAGRSTKMGYWLEMG